MKNRKGFVTATIMIVYLSLVLAILGLLVWFGFRISEGLTAVFTFLTTWWWLILIGFVLIFYRDVVRSLIKKVFKV